MGQIKSAITIAAIASVTSFSALLGANVAIKRGVALEDLVNNSPLNA